MEKGRPSATATFAAMLRAAHLLWDDEPKIFEDTLALQLSGCANEAGLRPQLDQIAAEAARSTSPGFRLDAPAMFSWLGVTMYLTPDAIFSTLRTVATLALGTQIIFQYSVPKEFVDAERQKILAVRAAFTAARGEPIQTFFEPIRLAEQLRELGFSEISDLSPEEAEARYFPAVPTVFDRLARNIL